MMEAEDINVHLPPGCYQFDALVGNRKETHFQYIAAVDRNPVVLVATNTTDTTGCAK